MGQHVFQNISVSSQFLFQVFRSCQELGARKPVLLSALDLTDSHLRDPQARFDNKAITALCQATSRELGRDNILRDVGGGIVPTGFSDIGYRAMFEKTVGDVLQAAAVAMDFGVNRPLLRWEKSASACRLIWDSDSSTSRDLISLIFTTLSRIGNAVTSDDLTPIKAVCFAHREHWNCNGSERAENQPLTAPCFFDQSETYLELHKAIVDLPNPFGNPKVVGAGQHQLNRFQIKPGEPASLRNLSYNYLLYLLDKSGLSLDAAAETFGIAERTLRRKLVAEGTSFRRILEQVRRDTCQLYFLEGTRSLSEIATKLGYSELSAFTRAYTAWYGRSPSRDMAAHIVLAA
tara:strand:+ start:1387 stop:2427 length:1041 start_codon:yes stop_codon:yes gene_type:complete